MPAYDNWQIHIRMAEEAEKQNQLPVASAAYQLALKEAQNIEGGHDIRAYTFIKMAGCSFLLGDVQAAEQAYLTAVNTAQSADMVISAAHDLAKLYFQLKNKEASGNYYQYALQVVSYQKGAQSDVYFELEKEFHGAMQSLEAEKAARNAPVQPRYNDHENANAQTEQRAGSILQEWSDNLEQAESAHRNGDLDSCKAHSDKALKIAELIGRDSDTYLETLKRVASLCASRADIKEAERHLLAAYGIKLGKFGAGHVEVAETTQELAILYFNSGSLAKAEPWAKRTKEIFEAATTGDTKELACALHNLAVLYHSLNDYHKAEPFYQRALYMKINLYGNADLESINLMRGYADLLRRTGRDEEAERMESQASGVLSGAYAIQDQLVPATEEYIPSI